MSNAFIVKDVGYTLVTGVASLETILILYPVPGGVLAGIVTGKSFLPLVLVEPRSTGELKSPVELLS